MESLNGNNNSSNNNNNTQTNKQNKKCSHLNPFAQGNKKNQNKKVKKINPSLRTHTHTKANDLLPQRKYNRKRRRNNEQGKKGKKENSSLQNPCKSVQFLVIRCCCTPFSPHTHTHTHTPPPPALSHTPHPILPSCAPVCALRDHNPPVCQAGTMPHSAPLPSPPSYTPPPLLPRLNAPDAAAKHTTKHPHPHASIWVN